MIESGCHRIVDQSAICHVRLYHLRPAPLDFLNSVDAVFRRGVRLAETKKRNANARVCVCTDRIIEFTAERLDIAMRDGFQLLKTSAISIGRMCVCVRQFGSIWPKQFFYMTSNTNKSDCININHLRA